MEIAERCRHGRLHYLLLATYYLLLTYYVQAEIAELVGDDELLNRELLQQLQATRGGEGTLEATSLETQPMTLDEFLSLLR